MDITPTNESLIVRLRVGAIQTNVKAAARKRAAVLHDISIGSFSYIDHFPNSNKANHVYGGMPSTATFKELKYRFMELRLTDIASTGHYQYRMVFGHCVKLVGEDRIVSTMIEIGADELRSALVTSYASSTASFYWTAIAPFFGYAYRHGITERNLVESIKAIK